jgi:hypothetical protein
LAALPALAQGPAAGSISLAEYRSELASIAEALENGGLETARERARALLAVQIASGEERLSPDATLLGPVAAGAAGAQAMAQARALRRLAGRLPSSAASSGTGPDRALLERLAAEQGRAELQRGGKVDLRLKPLKLSERVERALGDTADWLARQAERLWRLLRRLWPSRKPGGAAGLEVSSATTVLVSIAAAALVLLALRALAAKRGKPPSQLSEETHASSRDDDPLSRETDEWERYAAELAAKGRLREALRAHYHAVLVALLRAGLLSHQKGRTNWEYAAQLGPELGFRPSFIELTRRFDGEWYGGKRTTAEALAEYAQQAEHVLRAARGEGALA